MRATITVAGREVVVDLPSSGDQPLVNGEPVPGVVRRIRSGVYSVIIGGRSFEVVLESPPGMARDAAGAHGGVAEIHVAVDGRATGACVADERRRTVHPRGLGGLGGLGGSATSGGAADFTVVAPMPGRIVALPVEVGSSVERGQTVVVLEAMKMESSLSTPRAGTVKEVLVAPGQTVQQRQPLVRIDG